MPAYITGDKRAVFVSFMQNVGAAAISLKTKLQTGACIDNDRSFTLCD